MAGAAARLDPQICFAVSILVLKSVNNVLVSSKLRAVALLLYFRSYASTWKRGKASSGHSTLTIGGSEFYT